MPPKELNRIALVVYGTIYTLVVLPILSMVDDLGHLPGWSEYRRIIFVIFLTLFIASSVQLSRLVWPIVRAGPPEK